MIVNAVFAQVALSSVVVWHPDQFYFALAPETVQSPAWMLNFTVGEDSPWVHVPTSLLPPACLPVEIRSEDRPIALWHQLRSELF